MRQKIINKINQMSDEEFDEKFKDPNSQMKKNIEKLYAQRHNKPFDNRIKKREKILENI